MANEENSMRASQLTAYSRYAVIFTASSTISWSYFESEAMSQIQIICSWVKIACSVEDKYQLTQA